MNIPPHSRGVPRLGLPGTVSDTVRAAFPRRPDGYWLIVDVRIGSLDRGAGRAFTSSGATRDLRKLCTQVRAAGSR